MNVEQILAKLVSFPILGGEPNLAIIEWLEEYLANLGITTHRVYNAEKTKSSLHCRIGPAVDGGIILSGHTDVVPVAGQNWNTDPFILTPIGDKLYGRGSCDMKAFLACFLSVAPTMIKTNLKKPIYFALSYDEEIGCIGAPDLIAAISKHYDERPAYAWIGEPSMLMPIVGQKGICVQQTIVNGSAGHSSRIRQEVSAIHEAAKLVLWLENKMNELAKESIDDRFHPPHSSIHVGTFNGGIAPNVIADRCSFKWDIRCIPKDSIPEILAEFEAHCRIREAVLRDLFPAFKIETINDHPEVPALDTKEDAEITLLIKELTGSSILDTVAYAAEAGQFEFGGFPAIICGPGDIAQAHRANEFVAKDQLHHGVVLIERLVQKFS
ncbi:MAG: acetylornithine deacetylase [Flammeovirgaceae bacterium]|jgi:acetylornithine deacetylase|nr:acetylornithine deacetylase [Flammeovirgaceae bacterium]|tara:strand:- start:12863 stop:14008 length:1146 start_codon:yes stop_codon:yes gene_type:complete